MKNMFRQFKVGAKKAILFEQLFGNNPHIWIKVDDARLWSVRVAKGSPTKAFHDFANQLTDDQKWHHPWIKIYRGAILLFEEIGPRAAFQKCRRFLKGIHKLETPPLSACRKGCSACCYQRVAITEQEAEELTSYLTSDDVAHLGKQLGRAVEDYTILSADSRCVFLDEKSGSCRVYDKRPLICRNHYASDPQKCITDEEQLVPSNLAADAVLSAYWEASKTLHLPDVLLELFSQQNKGKG